ncbi:MAG: hypothetical protein AAF739_04905 [Pseudomonadota bacterium]
MKALLLFFLSALLVSAPAKADIFYFETGSYYGERDIRWPGKLISLDAVSGLLTFRYINGGVPVDIDVHVTRIYSITFDGLDNYDEEFPPTRRPLTEPLPTGLTARDQVVELENTSFLGDDIPNNIRIRPNRDARHLSLRGALVRHDGQLATLSAWTTERSFSDFDLSALALRSWIRGR